MVLSGTMRAYGVVLVPLAIQIVALFPIRPGFYWQFYPSLQGDALWWSFPVSSIASALMTWLLYTRGGWRGRTGATA